MACSPLGLHMAGRQRIEERGNHRPQPAASVEHPTCEVPGMADGSVIVWRASRLPVLVRAGPRACWERVAWRGRAGTPGAAAAAAAVPAAATSELAASPAVNACRAACAALPWRAGAGAQRRRARRPLTFGRRPPRWPGRPGWSSSPARGCRRPRPSPSRPRPRRATLTIVLSTTTSSTLRHSTDKIHQRRRWTPAPAATGALTA